jgi:long-chain acyl-CoA synthetase
LASDLISSSEHGPLGWLRWVDERPEHPALLSVPDQQTVIATSWAELARQVATCADGLWQSGFRPGDRWVHALGNSPAGVVAMLASLSEGVVEVPLDPALSSVEQQRLTERVGGRRIPGDESPTSASSALTAHATASQSLSAVVERLRTGSAQSEADRSAAPALILCTSGSLGTPKPVTLSLGNLSSNAAAKLTAVPQTVADVRLVLVPIWHAYARTCDLGTWLLSGCSLGIGVRGGTDGKDRDLPGRSAVMAASAGDPSDAPAFGGHSRSVDGQGDDHP